MLFFNIKINVDGPALCSAKYFFYDAINVDLKTFICVERMNFFIGCLLAGFAVCYIIKLKWVMIMILFIAVIILILYLLSSFAMIEKIVENTEASNNRCRKVD